MILWSYDSMNTIKRPILNQGWGINSIFAVVVLVGKCTWKWQVTAEVQSQVRRKLQGGGYFDIPPPYKVWQIQGRVLIPHPQKHTKHTVVHHLVELNRINELHSPYCWKKCSNLGTYSHRWWDCPILRKFWSRILHQIYILTGHKISLRPEMVLLNLWDIATFPLPDKEILFILLSAAKSLIALHWNKPTVPHLDQWYSIIWDHFLMDKISDSITPQGPPEPIPVSLLDGILY